MKSLNTAKSTPRPSVDIQRFALNASSASGDALRSALSAPAFAHSTSLRASAGRPHASSIPGSDVPALHARRSTLNAFTLVELLVVIVVIAVLMSITLPLSRYAIRRANESRQKVMLAKISSALEEYRSAYGEYPITPPGASADVLRHYPASYATRDKVSSSTNVLFRGTNTQEVIYDIHGSNVSSAIDYCLTYPLMLKQLEKGSRPFMEFPEVDVAYLVTDSTQTKEVTKWRRTKSGGWSSRKVLGIYGDAVKRPKAIDPVTGYQWKYVCTNGLNYDLSAPYVQ